MTREKIKKKLEEAKSIAIEYGNNHYLFMVSQDKKEVLAIIDKDDLYNVIFNLITEFVEEDCYEDMVKSLKYLNKKREEMEGIIVQ